MCVARCSRPCVAAGVPAPLRPAGRARPRSEIGLPAAAARDRSYADWDVRMTPVWRGSPLHFLCSESPNARPLGSPGEQVPRRHTRQFWTIVLTFKRLSSPRHRAAPRQDRPLCTHDMHFGYVSHLFFDPQRNIGPGARIFRAKFVQRGRETCCLYRTRYGKS